MADEVDEIPQALRHALKEDFHTYGINHRPFEEKKKNRRGRGVHSPLRCNIFSICRGQKWRNTVTLVWGCGTG